MTGVQTCALPILHKSGRPILIGTTDVAKSEKLSAMLKRIGIKHELLNAKPENVAREAEIVAQAGRMNAVTISTNMAGRGTDIILGQFSRQELLESWKAGARLTAGEAAPLWLDGLAETEAALRAVGLVDDGLEFGGRNLTVNEARPQERRPGGGGGFGGDRGGNRGGGSGFGGGRGGRRQEPRW